ncbi:hypothetical protein [Paenirhodobacter sp.]|uniref:hypothetical protein n=1 Tax=Paenirhodobacter sp. TaxID=1965326 RepID=UPI003B50AD57
MWRRDRIAALMASRIARNEVVMIGSGATAWHTARHIAATCSAITAITNDHTLAAALCENSAIQMICLGGRPLPAERYVYRPQTLVELGSYRANWASIGASGIDAAGAHDIDDQAAGAHRAMIRQPDQTALLVDH